MEDIKRCPFCGWYEIILDNHLSVGDKNLYVCTHCQSMSPIWNDRAIENELEEKIYDLEDAINRISKIL